VCDDRCFQVRDRGGAERLMEGGELFDGHRAGFEQPPEIGRQIGDG
jgi:hypothetical protein